MEGPGKSSSEASIAWQIGGCEYYCALCDGIFPHSLVFWGHVSSSHQMTAADYKKTVSTEYCIKKFYMVCKICRATILFDFGRMWIHFRKQHSLPLKEYYENYVAGGGKGGKCQDEEATNVSSPQDSPIPANEAVRDHEKEKTEKTNLYKCSLCPKLKKEFDLKSIALHLRNSHKMTLTFYQKNHAVSPKLPQKKPVVSTNSGDWFDGCTFKCTKCHFTCKSKSRAIEHAKAKHYDPEGVVMLKEEKIQCKMCGNEILHEHDAIKAHLRSEHEATRMSAYYKEYIRGPEIPQEEKKEKLPAAKKKKKEDAPSSSGGDCKCAICNQPVFLDGLDEHLDTAHDLKGDEFSKKSVKNRMLNQIRWNLIKSGKLSQ